MQTKEPFQVIWRRLSFGVSSTIYDKLLETASNVLGSRNEQTKVDPDERFQNSNSNNNRWKRIIFENLNGLVKSGEISAILGPSGAGKTSLLNAICGRVENYRGSLQLVGGGNRRMRLSIIPQKDYLLENLTVRENLLYSSRILNTSSDFDHEANIMRVIKMLNLINCLDSSVSKISGGEYKRVSIGQELLRQPDILILDEPTSGLDSLNCKNLIKSLVRLIEASRQGTMQPIAIIMTIHQPDIDIFQMFNRVYCMARRGRVIFEGHPSEVLGVVREHAGLSEAQKESLTPGNSMGINPANLLIEIASEHIYGQEPIENLARFQRSQFLTEMGELSLLNSSRSSSITKLTDQQTVRMQQKVSSKDTSLTSLNSYYTNPNVNSSLDNLDNSTELGVVVAQQQRESHLVRDKKLAPKSKHNGHFWHHTNILARRAFTSTLRDPLMTLTSLLFHLSIPFVMWTVYNQKIGTSNACPLLQREMDIISMVSNSTLSKVSQLQESVMISLECSTMFFLSTYSFSMCSLSIAALAFPLNMHVLLKEVRNGWYNLPSYVVAKTIATFPFEVLFPVFSSMMIYVLLGMPSSYLEWRLWAIALVTGLVAMISHTQGLIFGAICMNSVQTAIFLASASTLPQSLLSGFTARISNMPWFLQRLSWLSLYRFSSDTTNMIRFGFGTCPCDQTTEQYLQQTTPTFTDVPQQMKPLFSFYLTNTAEDPNTVTTPSPLGGEYGFENNTSANVTTRLASSLITGLTRELTVNSSTRSEMLSKIESNDLDLFARMASLMTRSFTYGRDIHGCESVRSELLITTGAPADDFLPFMFLGMFGLLVAFKIILFLVVKIKIGSNI